MRTKSKFLSFVANWTAILFGTAGGLAAGSSLAFLIWRLVQA